MIELRAVSKSFGGAAALLPTSLSFEPGRTTALIGPSGCGKSTILKLIIGLLSPDAGVVAFDGAPVTATTLQSARRRMGYVIQDGGLFPHLTAEMNVLLMARHLGKPEAESRKRIAALCELTRFPAAGLARYPLELSGGQRQRVSLMRALMLEPELLLLDEPLGALDPLVRFSLQEELKEIFGKLGQTVILVTHDLAEAAFLGHRIVLMQAGRIVQAGTLDDLRDKPAEPFVSEFLRAQRQPGVE